MCRAAELADLYTRHAELAVAQRRPADGVGPPCRQMLHAVQRLIGVEGVTAGDLFRQNLVDQAARDRGGEWSGKDAKEAVWTASSRLAAEHAIAAAPPFDPRWLTGEVLGIVDGMRAAGDYSALPILADALQEAGCTDTDPRLAHLRGGGDTCVVAAEIDDHRGRASAWTHLRHHRRTSQYDIIRLAAIASGTAVVTAGKGYDKGQIYEHVFENGWLARHDGTPHLGMMGYVHAVTRLAAVALGMTRPRNDRSGEAAKVRQTLRAMRKTVVSVVNGFPWDRPPAWATHEEAGEFGGGDVVPFAPNRPRLRRLMAALGVPDDTRPCPHCGRADH